MRVNYASRPDEIGYAACPDGTYVYFRENIVEEPAIDGGEPQYSADEYAVKLGCGEGLARQRVAANKAAWMAKAKAPVAPAPTAAERIQQLEAENAMLTECVLEMSEILYG